MLDSHSRIPQIIESMFEFKSEVSVECVFVLNMPCLFSQVAAVALMRRPIQWAAGPGHGGLSPTYRSKIIHSSHSLLLLCLLAHNINK